MFIAPSHLRLIIKGEYPTMIEKREVYYTPDGEIIGGLNQAYYHPDYSYADANDYIGSNVKQHDLDNHKQWLKSRTGNINRIFQSLDDSLLYVNVSWHPDDFLYWQIPQVHHAAQRFHAGAYDFLKASVFQHTLNDAKKHQSSLENLLGFRIPDAVFNPFKDYLYSHLFGAFTGKIDNFTISVSIEITLDYYNENILNTSITFQCPEDIVAARNHCTSAHYYGRQYSTSRFNTKSNYIRQKVFFISSYSLLQGGGNFNGILRPEQVPILFSMFKNFQPDPDINKLLLQSAYRQNFQAKGNLPQGPIYPFDRRNAIDTAIYFHDQTVRTLKHRWHAPYHV